MRFEQTGADPVQLSLQPGEIVEGKAPRKRMINDIHQLRGIAIMGVMLVHGIWAYLSEPSPPVAADGAACYFTISPSCSRLSPVFFFQPSRARGGG